MSESNPLPAQSNPAHETRKYPLIFERVVLYSLIIALTYLGWAFLSSLGMKTWVVTLLTFTVVLLAALTLAEGVGRIIQSIHTDN